MAVNKAVFQEEQGQACFVFPGRPEPLERELEKGSPEWAKAAGQEVLNCCKTTPPICTKPQARAFKTKAAANHLFSFFFSQINCK